MLFITTGQGPCVRVRSIGVNPTEFRTTFRSKFERRRSPSVASVVEQFDANACQRIGFTQPIWLEALRLGMEINETGAGGVLPYPGHCPAGQHMEARQSGASRL